jgi:hypothetical protein
MALITVKRWVETYSWPPEGGLRHLIFHARELAFEDVVCRVGRRVLIDEEKFWAWVARRAEKSHGR